MDAVVYVMVKAASVVVWLGGHAAEGLSSGFGCWAVSRLARKWWGAE